MVALDKLSKQVLLSFVSATAMQVLVAVISGSLSFQLDGATAAWQRRSAGHGASQNDRSFNPKMVKLHAEPVMLHAVLGPKPLYVLANL